MIHTRQIIVKPNDEYFTYFDEITKATTKLYNTTLCRLKQVMTAMRHDPEEWTNREQAIMQEITDALPDMNEQYGFDGSIRPRFTMPTPEDWLLKYNFMYALFRVTKNPDFCTKALPSQVAQNVIYAACKNMKRYAEAKNKGTDFHLPKYLHGTRRHRANFPTQAIKYKVDNNGRTYLQFPRTKLKFYLKPIDCGVYKLVRVFVKYQYGVFYVSVTLDDHLPAPQTIDNPQRICAIDIGVNNLAAITNNIGEPCLLFKGGIIKSANNLYNKQLISMRKSHCLNDKYVIKHLPEYQKATIRRNNLIRDFMFKVSKMIIEWCVGHDIDTIVVGNMRRKLTEMQTDCEYKSFFVPIPFDTLRKQLQFKAAASGIKFIEVDESYTSQASFLDGDEIPCENEPAVFSGFRGPTSYKGTTNYHGLQGLYQTADGTIVNADLNASANIGHKAYPTVFNKDTVSISDGVIIIKHPNGTIYSTK